MKKKKTPSTPLTLDWPRLSGSYCVIFLRESLRPFPLKKKTDPQESPEIAALESGTPQKWRLETFP